MSIVFTRWPPTTTYRRRGALPACGAPFNRLHPVKMIPAAVPAASLKNPLRLDMAKPPRKPEAHRALAVRKAKSITSHRVIELSELAELSPSPEFAMFCADAP